MRYHSYVSGGGIRSAYLPSITCSSIYPQSLLKIYFFFLLSTLISDSLDLSWAFPFNFLKGSLDTSGIGYKSFLSLKKKKLSLALNPLSPYGPMERIL